MRSFIHRYRLLAGGLALASLALAAVVAFQLGLGLRDEKPVAADDPAPSAANSDATPTPLPTFPGHEITPAPGATPDMSQPFWWVPYRNADRMAPKFTGEIAGITIDPAGDFSSSCPSDERPTEASAEAVATSDVALTPSYLPDGAVLEDQTTGACSDGVVQSNSLAYSWYPDPPRQGQGGYIRITRWLQEAPGASFAFPESRWSEGEVKGRPAAIAAPILPVGVGESVVVIHEDGITTAIYASGLPLELTTAIAAGLYE